MGIEKREIDGKEVEVEVSMVDGKEVITPVKPKEEPSQGVVDRIWKQMKEGDEKHAAEIKELGEKLKKSEEDKVDLVGRVKKLEPAEVVTTDEKKYGLVEGKWCFPQTKEAWENLFDDDPTFATDLRGTYNKLISGHQEGIQKAQLSSALKVAKELLPEAYKHDEDGKLVLDDNGHPVADEKSDAFKLYCQVAAESGVDANGQPIIFATKDGPEMIALRVKAVQGTAKEKELKEKADKEKKETEAKRLKGVKEGQVTPPGQAPPPPPKVEVKFNSDYERAAAEKKVAEGKFKDLEDFCRTRDSQNIGYGRGGV